MGQSALVPSDVIRNVEFRSACLAMLLMSAVFFATVLYMPQFMEKILGYSPLEAGLGMLPMLGTFAVVSFIAGPLYERIGAKLTVTVGRRRASPSGRSCSRWSTPTRATASLVAGLVVTGVGVGLFYPVGDHRRGHRARPLAREPRGRARSTCSRSPAARSASGITTTIFTITSENELAEKASAAGANLTDHQVAVMHGVACGHRLRPGGARTRSPPPPTTRSWRSFSESFASASRPASGS